jgi:DNA replication protein DnaC
VLDEHKTASHVEVLERLLGIEVEATATRRRESRRRLAGLPAEWRLEDFDTDAQPSIAPELLRDLAELRFVDDGGNVLFIGPPGVGKTMLAIGLGHAAIDAGHRVYCTTAADPGRPLPQGRPRGTLGQHHAVLRRTRAARDR